MADCIASTRSPKPSVLAKWEGKTLKSRHLPKWIRWLPGKFWLPEFKAASRAARPYSDGERGHMVSNKGAITAHSKQVFVSSFLSWVEGSRSSGLSHGHKGNFATLGVQRGPRSRPWILKPSLKLLQITCVVAFKPRSYQNVGYGSLRPSSHKHHAPYLPFFTYSRSTHGQP